MEKKYPEELLKKASNLKQAYHDRNERADWRQIKDILLESGYHVGNEEALRGRVKAYEKALGILKTGTEYRSEEITHKLNDVREKVGEMNVLRIQTRQEKTALSKIQKDFVRAISVAEDLKEFMIANDFTVVTPEYCEEPINVETNDNVLIIHITDWHIGYLINNCKGNSFNWAIANERVLKLLSECYKVIKLYNIKKAYVINTGDVIEHTYMRKTQSQYCEFLQAEQINKAIELIHKFLVALSKYCFVVYDSIPGNHDRFAGDKTQNLDGDNSEVIIREQLQMYAQLSQNQRLAIIKRSHTDKEIVKEIHGKKLKFMHGDGKSSDGKKLIKDEISMDNEFYDIIFKGHLHNFSIESENHGRYIVSTGCLSAYNDYSTAFGCCTLASQTLAVISQHGIELIKDVILS